MLLGFVSAGYLLDAMKISEVIYLASNLLASGAWSYELLFLSSAKAFITKRLTQGSSTKSLWLCRGWVVVRVSRMLPVLTSSLKRLGIYTAAFSTLLQQWNGSNPALRNHLPAATGWPCFSPGGFWAKTCDHPFTFLNLHVTMNSLPEALVERNIFWLFIDVNKIQFPAEILSSGLESASFLDSSWRCSQPGRPGPSQDFGVKEQRWLCKMYSLMGDTNSCPLFPAVGLPSSIPP